MNENQILNKNFSVAEHGFSGTLYQSINHLKKDKILIICGGSNGNFAGTTKIAEIFCEYGINTLALAYINAPGLPKHTIEAPIESAENAVTWLDHNGFNKIGIYGLSSGGEYALLAATLIPRITCVVAISAPCVVSQADNGISYKNTSCWSWRKQALDYMKINYSLIKAIPTCLFYRELHTKQFYEKGIKATTNNPWIAVEQINGPVLLLTAKEDSICPSSDFAQLAMQRMENNNFSFSYEHVEYQYGSHFLVPIENPKSIPLTVFAIERIKSKECATSRVASLNKTLEFLRQW